MRTRQALLLCWTALAALGPADGASAQHEHHPPPTEAPAAPPAVSRNLFQSDMSLMAGMSPEETPEGTSRSGWSSHFLGVARLTFNDQGGPSGASVLESTNWTMVMAQRVAGRGLFTLMLMNSLEPATLREKGSPHLFQTGETFEGRRLVDSQHPHDFFMNLSATYRVQLAQDAAAWIQLAPVGEPALGPTAFMHRASAGENPTSPLGHHWQDSTHITYNVATVGWGWRWLSVEGSVFNGEEPDEGRWDIDGGKPDSVSARATLRLPRGWSGQLSHGYLHEPEALEEGDTHRTTASVQYGAGGDRAFAATLLWGRNDEDHGVSDSYLLEGAYQITAADHAYGRLEWAEKDYHLLQFKGAEVTPAIEVPEIAEIGSLTLGYVRQLRVFGELNVAAGGDVTAYQFPSRLEPVYGNFPVSAHAFLRLRWGRALGGAGHQGH